MAIQRIFAVHDKKVGCYGKLFCETSDILATRGLSMVTNEKGSQLSFFPEDFDLYFFGTFDDCSGEMKLVTPPVFIVSAISQRRLSLEMDRVQAATDPSILAQRPGPGSAVERR